MGIHSSWAVCLGQYLVVSLSEVNERGGCSGLTPSHCDFKKHALGWIRYRDANPVSTSPLADDITTPPSGLVISLGFEQTYLYLTIEINYFNLLNHIHCSMSVLTANQIISYLQWLCILTANHITHVTCNSPIYLQPITSHVLPAMAVYPHSQSFVLSATVIYTHSQSHYTFYLQ